MLSELAAEEIARERARGAGGPIVLKWVDQLLADRKERIAELENVRKRLHQAYVYLDGLLRDLHRPPAAKHANGACPKCGKQPGP